MTNKPFFSIIVPFLNTEKYINGCIRSIQGQSYGDFEAIFIDDGSEDDSLKIFTECIRNDHRFKLIKHQENRGEARSRNEGIEKAKGEYLLFFDSDDYFSPDTLSRIFEEVERTNSDIVVFGGDTFPDRTWASEEMYVQSGQYSNGIDSLMHARGARPFAANKAIRTNLITANDCCFNPDLKLGLDQAFVFSVFPYARRLSFIADTLYHYRQWSGSVTSEMGKDEDSRVYNHVLIVDSIVHDWSNRGLLNDRDRQAALSNWSIDYLFEDLILNGGGYLATAFSIMQSWFRDEILNDRLLSDVNKRSLTCISSFNQFHDSTANPPVSIVIPIYNSDEYLEEALYSLRRQTMANYEVVMVDDGSTDGSLDIAEKFIARDSRFKLFQQEHEGAGAARNLGLSKATGNYIIFLDSDDYSHQEMLEKSLSKIQKYDADICIFQADGLDAGTGHLFKMPWICDTQLIPHEDPFSINDSPDNIFCFTTPAPWSKLFRTQFLRDKDLSFQNIRSSNDLSFSMTALAEADRIVTIEESLLTYRVNNPHSLQATQDKDPFIFFDALIQLRSNLANRGLYERAERAYINFALDICLYQLRNVQSTASFEELYSFLKDTGFDYLNLTDKTESDFYAYDSSNYAKMRFILRNPARSYQIEYPNATCAPLIQQHEKYERIDSALEPIRNHMPNRLKKPLGKIYRRIKGQ